MHDMTHDDLPQDAEMIKSVLHKIIDEMDALEAGRINPKMVAKVDVAVPHNESTEPAAEEASETPEEESSELDPEVLKQLMDKAGHADESGATEEENTDELPPSLADAVRRKKAMK